MNRTASSVINMPINRVQGDLELALEVQANKVTNAWSSSTLYRGFENMLKGRGARDGLVITPRVCALCSTAHLFAAVTALEQICDVTPPNNAILVRNICLLAEHVQSDIRHGVLSFFKDFMNPAYAGLPLYEEACRRYASLRGESVIETIRMTKKILEVVAIFGGQWPNSSFMVPGGIAGIPSFNDLVSCQYIVNLFRSWYEQRILGCTIERWSEVRSEIDLQRWMNEQEAHFNSDLGFFIRFSHMIRLHELGAGDGNFMSFGHPHLPNQAPGTHVQPGNEHDSGIHTDSSNTLGIDTHFGAGVIIDNIFHPFDQSKISEHVAYSHFKDYNGGRHPSEGITDPVTARYEKVKYSYAKAPRYDELPVETGPLAQMLVSRNPLFTDIARSRGPNVYLREMARIVRPAILLPKMHTWLEQIDAKAPYYTTVGSIPDGKGHGLIGASRGALGHWVEIENSRIKRYQIITPTSWNGSPRDQNSIPGPWESAVIGTSIENRDNPIEVEHIIRSFDPCQSCSVHTAQKAKR
ncbi:nickel-dependent hydrogenase large subunit [Desulfosediminicola sp.]|uniref:nickel-dependent hydrogenase large subunit n=1 Tax=Desulfosediminicola sp. TaxID=2886825 RepID=UPI003AF276BB